MQNQIEKLLETIKADYLYFTSRGHTKSLSEINERMISEFNEELGYSVGRKYIKIPNRNGGRVWGFVQIEDDKKFKAGDILKAAGWATPARNSARGNVFKEYSVSWTGPHYLK